ncbi:cysteine-rich repeat secretory protein 55 [Quercus suber]|uniref:Cysteine-rich repeat secretory protein 55 n=1 Tax=Quercus suber TaxID=58331 RepID=A0AAW0M5U3_QUESU
MTWFPKPPPTSYGKNQDQVFGLGQCRGDVSSKDCSSCIQDAAKQIRQCCPNQADARIWYEHCFLRYNNKSFIGEIDTSFGTLMDQIRAQAVETNNEGLGKGETKLSSFLTLHA